MKKVLKIEVDCAVCAGKIQEAVGKVEGVNSVTVNFMTQKMILDLDDAREEELLKTVYKTAKKVEPDFCIVK